MPLWNIGITVVLAAHFIYCDLLNRKVKKIKISAKAILQYCNFVPPAKAGGNSNFPFC